MSEFVRVSKFPYPGGHRLKQPFRRGRGAAHTHTVVRAEPFRADLSGPAHIVRPYVHRTAQVTENLAIGAVLSGHEYDDVMGQCKLRQAFMASCHLLSYGGVHH